MDGIRKKIEDILSAVSFAEEGEFEAARDFIKRERKVLLALSEKHIDPRTFKYALNSASRISARIDILLVSSSSVTDPTPDPMLQQLQSDLKREGIPFTFIRKTGCMKQEIIDYANKERGVLFVVVDSPKSLDAECKKKDSRLSELWQNLRCPLVVVSEARA